jgi:hypothetical protein
MSGCPYTWFKSLLVKSSDSSKASVLRVKVSKENSTLVDVSLPARSAGWLMDLIPDDVILKIKSEGIPLESIQADLASMPELYPQKIFNLQDQSRNIDVWLE